MRVNRGFSLAEVLVSLFLVTVTSFALIKQQWHMGQYLNQTITRNITSWQFDNVAEQVHRQVVGR